MADTLSLISIISFAVAGACFVCCVVLFFLLGIPGVIGDLSGHNARKSIKKMRLSNERSGNKAYRSSAENVRRGTLTETMKQKPEESKGKATTVKNKSKSETDGNTKKRAAQNSYAVKESAASVRSPVDEPIETGLLNTSRNRWYSESTSLLNSTEPGNMTSEYSAKSVDKSQSKKLVAIEDIMIIHTDEVIK